MNRVAGGKRQDLTPVFGFLTFVAGRFGTGALVGIGLSRSGPIGPAAGVSLGVIAAMGDALHGISNGADNPEQVLRNIFGENAPAIPANRPNRTECLCNR